MALTGTIIATMLSLAPTMARASTSCLPNPGAACGWNATYYGGTKIFGDPFPTNGTQDTFDPSDWNELYSFKNRATIAACPMHYDGNGSWSYLDLLVPETNYPTLPSPDHATDAVWFGVSTKVNCF